jgi:carboxylesterase
MSWHGQINRTLWEIQQQVGAKPEQPRYRRELLRAHFLQRFEFDKASHVPRDDRTFLFMHEEEAPACLLLHGAQGTPAEMRELGNVLFSHGYTVFCPRFAREDTKGRMVSWQSWVTQAQTALDTVMTASRDVFIAGLSLGGTIAVILGGTKDLRGLVLLAPALFPRLSLKGRMVEIGRYLTPTVFYRLAGWNGEVLKAMDYTRRHTKKVDIPVLALQAADDRHLSTRGLRFLRRHCSHPRAQTRTLPHGSHVLTRGPAKAEVFAAVAEFLDGIARGGEAKESAAG